MKVSPKTDSHPLSFPTTRGGSNSIAKYYNTFEILQYLLQYFEILQYFESIAILIAIFLKFCNTYCNTFKILQYLLQYFLNFAIHIAIL